MLGACYALSQNQTCVLHAHTRARCVRSRAVLRRGCRNGAHVWNHTGMWRCELDTDAVNEAARRTREAGAARAGAARAGVARAGVARVGAARPPAALSMVPAAASIRPTSSRQARGGTQQRTAERLHAQAPRSPGARRHPPPSPASVPSPRRRRPPPPSRARADAVDKRDGDAAGAADSNDRWQQSSPSGLHALSFLEDGARLVPSSRPPAPADQPVSTGVVRALPEWDPLALRRAVSRLQRLQQVGPQSRG